MLLTDSAQELRTAHPRHHDIGDDQMNPPRALHENIEGLLPVDGEKHRVAGSLQDAMDKLPHPGVVFNDQDRLGPSLMDRRPALTALRFGRAFDPREIDPERRAGADFAVNPDR